MKAFIVGAVLYLLYIALSKLDWHIRINTIARFIVRTGKRYFSNDDPDWRHYLRTGEFRNTTDG